MDKREPDYYWFLGRAVRKARREAGLTQAELGLSLGLEKQRISFLERNGRGLHGPLLKRMAEILKTTELVLHETAFEWQRRELFKAEDSETSEYERRVYKLSEHLGKIREDRELLEDLESILEFALTHPEAFAPSKAFKRSRRLACLPGPPQERGRRPRSRKASGR